MGDAARLLVSGASGFLGAHVVEAAARAGWDVIAWIHDRPFPGSLPARARSVRADLALESGIELALASAGPSAVVHAAAISRMADCERDPEAARLVNALAPQILANWCRAHAARFVHVSTDLVFGAAAAPVGGFVEQDEPAPISAYGASKLAAERAVRSEEPRAWIVRLPLLVGPSHGRGLGASDSLHAALARGESPALFEDEWRTPLDVRCAAQALVELASREPSGVLHVAGPERMSRYELGLRALRQRGLRADRARALLRATTRTAAGVAGTRPADVSLDSSRARSLLTTLLAGLESGSI